MAASAPSRYGLEFRLLPSLLNLFSHAAAPLADLSNLVVVL
jgi:hypothetical protein